MSSRLSGAAPARPWTAGLFRPEERGRTALHSRRDDLLPRPAWRLGVSDRRDARGMASVMAARGRLGAIVAHAKYGPRIPGALLLTPRVKGGRRMAGLGALTLRDHGFGGCQETPLQKAWRLGTKADRDFLAATRRLAHRACADTPCRRCRRILDGVLQRRQAALRAR